MSHQQELEKRARNMVKQHGVIGAKQICDSSVKDIDISISSQVKYDQEFVTTKTSEAMDLRWIKLLIDKIN